MKRALTRAARHPKALLAFTALLAIYLISSAADSLHASDPVSPIERALGFLFTQQVSQPLDAIIDGARVLDFPGDWPQYFTLQGAEAFRVRDVSPFTVAFIHHALTHVVEANRGALGLSPVDLSVARLMRRRAVTFQKSFAAVRNAPDAGTFAFWPYDTDPNTPDPLLSFLLTAWLRGPILGGQRVPINLPLFPSTLAIPSDADVTSNTYATLLNDALFDGGRGSEVRFERFFVDWRDLGVVPRRMNPSWLPPASGAFLTWLTYRDSPFPLFPNDVDLVVNANVLYALARYNRLGVAGVAQAESYINFVTARGLYRDHPEEISAYYPNNLAFQYAVSRAFREGPEPALEPAVRIMADDLEVSARTRADGAAYWDYGDPHLNTAFAVLTLINAGRNLPLVDRAIDYLKSEQDGAGGFGNATFFFGRADGGQVFKFFSASFTTAMALEAFARYELSRCGRVETQPSAGVGRCR